MSVSIDFEKKVIDYKDDWESFKSWINGEHAKLSFTWVDTGNMYIVCAVDGIFTKIVSINKNTIETQIIQEDFENNYKTYNVLEKRQPDNKALLVTHVGREGNETIYATHNFCDPTTWFGDSVRTSEVLSGSGTVFSSSYNNWIDLRHGKVFDEEGYREDVADGYDVVVVANNVTMSMRQPFTNYGGDYIVNYYSGTIEFVNSQSYNQNEVTASFNYENGSNFYIRPYPFKKLDIEEVEAQFTRDVNMNDTMCFEIYGYVQIFAPQLWEGNGGPLPTNYKILLKSQKYHSIMQLIDEALGSYPIIPAIGGNNGRGLKSDMYGFPFRYGTVRTLYDSYGLEIRVYNENHIPHDGDRVTATFYCIASNEQ